MLILTRRKGEVIRIGDNIEITVVDVRGNQVRVGVNAPPGIAIHREEMFEKVGAQSFSKEERLNSKMKALGTMFKEKAHGR